MRTPSPRRRPPLNAALRALILLATVALPAWSTASPALPMAVTDPQALVEATTDSADFPLRYAVGLAPSLTEISGDSDGVDIFSAGANTLALRLRVHDWPDDVPLHWQSGSMDKPHRIQPGDGAPQWLPDVPGDMARLSWSGVDLPAAARITLEWVYHGYRDLQHPAAKAAGDAGACHVDVACPQAAAWGSPVRATTFITVGSGTSRSLCSASLLNNTANDGRPLLITARHCGVTSNNAASLNAVFNYQRSACGGANDGNDMGNVVEGSSWLAESVSADTTLVVLRRAVPGAFNAQFGAWSAVPVAPDSGAGIHHPNGDQKKISLFDGPATLNDNTRIGGGGLLGAGGFTVDAWGVRWREGATEAGSSGSGLWNQDRALVGVLSGGSSSCGNPNGTDLYGRLAVAWDESPALRRALDPVNGGTVRSAQAGTSASNGGGGGPPVGGGGGNTGSLTLVLMALAFVTRRAHHCRR